MNACEEVPPFIDFSENDEKRDTTWLDASGQTEAQLKNVLIEEFSGVRCVNCPAANEQVEELIQLYGNRINPITLHGGTFAVPIEDYSIQDLKTEEAESIISLLDVFGFPSASFDRRRFEGETDIPIYVINQWPLFIEEALETTTPVNIDLNANLSDGQVACFVQLHFTQDVIHQLQLNVYLIEDEIVDAQLFPGDIKERNYTHHHILREMLTPVSGKLIEARLDDGTISYKEGRVYEFHLNSSALPEVFTTQNLKVTASVSFNNHPDGLLDVLHSVATSVEQ